jgi:hypothetical protein
MAVVRPDSADLNGFPDGAKPWMKKEPGMNAADHRSTRFFWIAGIVLLIGTVIAVAFTMGNGAQGVTPTTANTPPVRHEGFAIGYVDMQHGIATPYPTQFGEIVALREEGFHAKKGEWLLKIDDQLARLRLAEAEAAFKEAEQYPKLHALKLKQQDQAIQAAKYRREATDFKISAGEREVEAFKETGAVKQYKDKLDADKATAKQIDCEIETAKIEKLELELVDPTLKVKQAKAVYDQARYAVDKCVLAAPEDGTLLRSTVHVGEALGANPKAPALEFAQDGKKIIRAEILQEWAGRFKKDQVVEIEDDSYNGPKWSGKIISISKWYSKKRSIILEPFTFNDVRSLECIVEVNDPDQTLCIGQRVRVGVIQAQ